jgi:Photosynthesis system II assembly factor YCF48
MKNIKVIFKIVLKVCCISFVIVSCKKADNLPPNENIPNLSIDSLKILTSNIPTAMYEDLTFVNLTTGFAISQGQIIKTTDGGYSWTSIATPVTVSLKKIQFTNNQTGYIIGGDKGGVLLKTIDGGESWNLVNSNISERINGMYFLNNQTGFVTGENLFSKTSNGGVSWTSVKSGLPRIYNDVNFKNSKEGFATASDGVYFRTTNGGASWDSVHISANTPLFNIYFAGSKVLVVKSSDTLIDLADNYAVTKIPNSLHKLLFLNAYKCVGIGSHYEQGFWPYGDIFTTNNVWASFEQKTYTQVDAIGFGAIAKMTDGKIMILGTGFSGTKVVVLRR